MMTLPMRSSVSWEMSRSSARTMIPAIPHISVLCEPERISYVYPLRHATRTVVTYLCVYPVRESNSSCRNKFQIVLFYFDQGIHPLQVIG